MSTPLSKRGASNGLDCNTARGRAFIAHELACLALLEKKWGVQLFPTRDDSAADIDAIAIRHGQIGAVLEVKARQLTLAQLQKFGSYLVTFDKLIKLREVAARLAVPGFLCVYLIPEETIVYWPICDPEGRLLAELSARTSNTQATCNGGETLRYNAYLSLAQMVVL